MHYYQFNIGDYAKATRHLSNTEDLAYRRLIELYYDTERPLINDVVKLSRLINMKDNKEEIQTVLEDFFIESEDGFKQNRIDSEIASYHSKAESARVNGKKGGRPKKAKANPAESERKAKKTQSVNLANPAESERKANQEPLTKNQDKTHTSPPVPDPVYPIFEYWREVMDKGPTTKPTKGRIDKIKARLKSYSSEQIKLAIDGCAGSSYHMGKDPKSNPECRIYDELTLICRSDEKLEMFIGYTKNVNASDQREQEVLDWANGVDGSYTGGETIDHE